MPLCSLNRFLWTFYSNLPLAPIYFPISHTPPPVLHRRAPSRPPSASLLLPAPHLQRPPSSPPTGAAPASLQPAGGLQPSPAVQPSAPPTGACPPPLPLMPTLRPSRQCLPSAPPANAHPPHLPPVPALRTSRRRPPSTPAAGGRPLALPADAHLQLPLTSNRCSPHLQPPLTSSRCSPPADAHLQPLTSS
ncbi:extensin-like [Phragmites australis]|uniref:extensin-like n=1 Tax=Phragmites australis TaxID=29695 RepID=UPI002D792FCF|nr:extensin-like [Phragmites australis]